MKEKRRYGKILMLGAGLVIAVFAVVSLDLNQLLRESLDWISGLGPWGPVAFALFLVVPIQEGLQNPSSGIQWMQKYIFYTDLERKKKHCLQLTFRKIIYNLPKL